MGLAHLSKDDDSAMPVPFDEPSVVFTVRALRLREENVETKDARIAAWLPD